MQCPNLYKEPACRPPNKASGEVLPQGRPQSACPMEQLIPRPTHLSLSHESLSVSAPDLSPKPLTLPHPSWPAYDNSQQVLSAACVPGTVISACGFSDFPPKYFSCVPPPPHAHRPSTPGLIHGSSVLTGFSASFLQDSTFPPSNTQVSVTTPFNTCWGFPLPLG